MNKEKDYHNLITMESIILKGEYNTKIVWINDKELDPAYSQTIYNHSQDGFDWGNCGAGAAQLALAVLLYLTKNKKISMILHHIFKNEFISSSPQSDFEIKINAGEWFYKNLNKDATFSK